ncbi:hypothetical protein ABH940_005085 [Streptacidiphilus sp. BW17]
MTPFSIFVWPPMRPPGDHAAGPEALTCADPLKVRSITAFLLVPLPRMFLHRLRLLVRPETVQQSGEEHTVLRCERHLASAELSIKDGDLVA